MKYLEEFEPETVEEYDKCIADGVREEILNVADKFKIDSRKIDELLLKVNEKGIDGIKIENLEREILDVELKRNLNELVWMLDKNYGGIAIIRGKNIVTMERRGYYYIREYLNL